jgi:Helix-turn-helix domain
MSEFTTSQAARAYEVHPNILSRLILMGRLTARKNVDGRWLISKESLDRWNRNRVRRAKPDNARSTGSDLAHVSA